jgi:hypothetical protein
MDVSGSVQITTDPDPNAGFIFVVSCVYFHNAFGILWTGTIVKMLETNVAEVLTLVKTSTEKDRFG